MLAYHGLAGRCPASGWRGGSAGAGQGNARKDGAASRLSLLKNLGKRTLSLRIKRFARFRSWRRRAQGLREQSARRDAVRMSLLGGEGCQGRSGAGG